MWPHILQPLLLPLCFARGFTCRIDVFFVPAACKLITDRHPARTNTLRLYILAATHNHDHRVIIIAINAFITIIIHSAVHSRLQPLAVAGEWNRRRRIKKIFQVHFVFFIASAHYIPIVSNAGVLL